MGEFSNLKNRARRWTLHFTMILSVTVKTWTPSFGALGLTRMSVFHALCWTCVRRAHASASQAYTSTPWDATGSTKERHRYCRNLKPMKGIRATPLLKDSTAFCKAATRLSRCSSPDPVA
eukprot:6129802-Karenia_brevis.AAC.1